MVPGHGPVQQGKTQLHRLIAFMEELVDGVKRLVREGKTLEEIKARLDLSKFKGDFPNFAAGSAMAIERAHAEATGKIKE